jgi:hypothetical protein
LLFAGYKHLIGLTILGVPDRIEVLE